MSPKGTIPGKMSFKNGKLKTSPDSKRWSLSQLDLLYTNNFKVVLQVGVKGH